MIKNHIIYSNFCDWTFNVKRAEGSFLWTDKGQKLIDFTSGWNVTNLGWNHPEINRAIAKQAIKNTYAPMWTADEIQNQYASELCDALPQKLKYIIRATGGTDANEKAMMVARTLTKRQTILGFLDTYHGHSFGTVSIGYRPEYAKDIAPTVPKFLHLMFPKATGNEKTDEYALRQLAINLEKIFKHEDVAAVITEAGIITGWGSTFVAPKGYTKLLRDLTKKYGTLLILDEVGTGFSRCGKLFGMEIENVVPDMATFAKGMSNGGAAIGAVAVSDDFDETTLSAAKTHSTFGWTSVACAAASATLKVHKKNRLWEKAAEDGQYMLKTLHESLSKYEPFIELNGLGMEIGLLFYKDKKILKPDNETALKVIDLAFNNGLHVIFGGDGNIQLMPPLTISKSTLNQGINILVNAVNKAYG